MMASTPRRVLLVGARGVIGRHVETMLKANGCTVISAGLDGDVDLAFDLCDVDAVGKALREAGPLGAVVSTAGRANFSPLARIEPACLKDSVYGLGLEDKLMGQVNLALAASRVLSVGASITLTSGTTSEDPILGGSSLSMVNGALEAWVRAAATEWPPGIRLNLVSPSLVEGTPEAQCRAFPGWDIMGAEAVGRAYLRCLGSGIHGRVVKV